MSVTSPGAGRAVTRDRWGMLSWLFMRLSALALIILALGHFAVQHVLNDVHDLDLAFVAARWSNLGWRIYDALLLTLGIAHGLNGLRIVIEDYVVQPQWIRVVRLGILAVGTIVIIIGAVAIIGGVRGV